MTKSSNDKRSRRPKVRSKNQRNNTRHVKRSSGKACTQQHSQAAQSARLILLNKPFKVISQFSASADKRTLAEFVQQPGFYPAGRLDYDSEGLLLLTDNGSLQARISHPQFKLQKRYWVQVEGLIDAKAIHKLECGITIKGAKTRPAIAKIIAEPAHLWARNPPIRARKNIPTSWLELAISEGRNRQVRRMTAAVGFPTLRLIRHSIGDWSLGNLKPGEQRQISISDIERLVPAPASASK